PGRVTDRRDRTALLEEVPHERDGLVVHAQEVGVGHSARQDQSAEGVRRRLADHLLDGERVRLVEMVERLDGAGLRRHQHGFVPGVHRRLPGLGQLHLLDALGCGQKCDTHRVSTSFLHSFRSGSARLMPASADPGSRSSARSPRLTTPTGSPFSTTGIRRTVCSRISRTAVDTGSSGARISGSGVHTDAALTPCGSRPSATARTVMSRSVSTPTTRSPSATTTSPMSWVRMSCAASAIEASGRTATTPGVITSLTHRVMTSVSSPLPGVPGRLGVLRLPAYRESQAFSVSRDRVS